MTLSAPPIDLAAQRCSVLFYDGRTSRAQRAVLCATDQRGVVRLELPDQVRVLTVQDWVIQGAIGHASPMIELPDNMRIELQQLDVPAWLQHSQALWWNRLWRWERSPTWIVASLLVTVLVLAGVVQYGIPALSTHIALALPADSLDDLGQQTLLQLDDGLLSASTLTPTRQAQIQAAYGRYIDPTSASRLLFREGGLLGANAFALPDGRMVMTDELVALSHNDLELVAVLAHETGHNIRRHALRQLIGGASLGVLIVALTGDTSNLLAALPAGLANMQYSRDFEREADDYAYQVMVKQHIPLHYFADILTRLDQPDAKPPTPTDKAQSKDPSMMSGLGDFLSSHPATAERVERFRQPAV